MTVYGRILLAGFGSAVLLLAALGFQYLGGLAPCPLCIWQRWPHAAAMVLAGLAITVMWRQKRALSALGALAMAIGAGIGLFHAGVEQGWWQGFAGCSAPDPAGLSTDALLERIMETDIARCDEIPWSFAGLSMAAWNAILSAGLAFVWLWSARRTAPGPGSEPPMRGSRSSAA